MLIADPSSTGATPTMADFFADFNNPAGPAHAQPFRDGGFTVNPPLSFSLGALESLKSGLNWSLLVARIATMIFLFPKTPVGGIRSGIVPSDSSFPWGGMALPRVGPRPRVRQVPRRAQRVVPRYPDRGLPQAGGRTGRPGDRKRDDVRRRTAHAHRPRCVQSG